LWPLEYGVPPPVARRHDLPPGSEPARSETAVLVPAALAAAAECQRSVLLKKSVMYKRSKPRSQDSVRNDQDEL